MIPNPAKRQIGIELKRLGKEDPERLAQILRGMSHQEKEAILFDWQVWARDNQIIRDYHEGWPEPIIVIMYGRGGGKDLDENTDILTYNRGWLKLKDVVVGDYVFDEMGKPARVTATYRPEKRKLYEFTFTGDVSLVSSEEHEWVTWTHRDRKNYYRRFSPAIPVDWASRTWTGDRGGEYGAKVRTTSEIVSTFYQENKRNDLNHCIPLSQPLQYPVKNLRVHPYLLGLWLGDGLSKGPYICSHVDDTDFYKAELETLGYVCDIRKQSETTCLVYVGISNPDRVAGSAGAPGEFNSAYKRHIAAGDEEKEYGEWARYQGVKDSLTRQLKDLGVYRNKHIPQAYLESSIEQRTQLLQGLMDTDGYLSEGQCEYTTTLPLLAEQVKFLADSLGMRATVSEGRATLYGKDCGPKYRVVWTNKVETCRLPRKKLHLPPCGESQKQRTQHRMITAYREVEYRPTVCLSVDSPNHLFLAGRDLIPTHNTRLASEWVRHKLTSRPINMAIMGPTSADTRDVMVSGPSGILACHPPSITPVYEPSYARVVWPNGSVAKMYSGEKGDRVRGGNNELLWIDEVGAIEDKDAFDQAMLSLRIGESRALLTTTPRKGNPILLSLWPRAVFNNDPPEEGKDVRILFGSTYENIDNLSATFRNQVIKAYEGTRLGQQEIEGRMLFDSEAALWSTELIEKQRRPNGPAMTMYAIGVDPAVTKKKGSDMTGIVGSGIGEDGFGYVLDDLTGKYGPSGWANRVKALYDQYSEKAPTVIVVERNNGGDALVSALHQVDKNLPVKTVFSTTDKISRATPVALLYEQGRIMHVGVFVDLENEMCSYDGTGKSPDRMDAAVFSLTELMLKKQYKTTVRPLHL